MESQKEWIWRLLPDVPEVAATAVAPYNGSPVLLRFRNAAVTGYAVGVATPGQNAVRWRIYGLPGFSAHTEIGYWCPLPEHPSSTLQFTKYTSEPRPVPGNSYLVYVADREEWVEAVRHGSDWIRKVPQQTLLSAVHFWRELPLLPKSLETFSQTRDWLQSMKEDETVFWK